MFLGLVVHNMQLFNQARGMFVAIRMVADCPSLVFESVVVASFPPRRQTSGELLCFMNLCLFHWNPCILFLFFIQLKMKKIPVQFKS